MPIAVAAPPQSVQIYSGFDYVNVDETHHRVVAAHTASKRLLVVDASTGAVSGQVDVGPVHGSAIDPATGDVFTGDGTDNNLSKVDPVGMKVLASVDVPGAIDAITYDAKRGRVYADQDGGPHVYVIDGASMKLIGTITMPADDLESPAVDRATGTLYQNLANGGGFAIVPAGSMTVSKVVKTPELEDNHPLIFSDAAQQVIAGGENGVLSAYSTDGKLIGSVKSQVHIDQCNTGSKGKLMVCAGRGIVTVYALEKGAAPKEVGRLDTGHAGIHTAGIDESNGDVWVVWGDTKGDWVQRLKFTP